jgi:hypothetical protein
MPALVSAVTVEWSPASDPFDDTPTWVDITGYVRAVSISRGRSGAFDLYGAGHATIVLNNGAGTFDQTAWYRWRQVRVTALATGPTTLEVFYGFVETILHSQPTKATTATATIQAVDLMGVISRYEFDADSVPLEASGLRVQRVIDAAALPAAWQSVVAGYADVAAMDDGIVNGLQHLQDVADAEVGAIFVSRQGVLAYEDRYELLDRLDSAAETTFSDTPTGVEVPMLMGDMTLTPPGRDYRNRVTFTPTSGTPQTASNVPANYPSDSLSRTVPVEHDSQALANANVLLEVFRQQTVWPAHVSVSVHRQNTLDRVCSLDLRRYCLVKFTPAGRAQQSYKVFVESIEHAITAAGEWTCRLGFSSADRWEDAWGTKAAYLELDDATLGLLDTGKLGF